MGDISVFNEALCKFNKKLSQYHHEMIKYENLLKYCGVVKKAMKNRAAKKVTAKLKTAKPKKAEPKVKNRKIEAEKLENKKNTRKVSLKRKKDNTKSVVPPVKPKLRKTNTLKSKSVLILPDLALGRTTPIKLRLRSATKMPNEMFEAQVSYDMYRQNRKKSSKELKKMQGTRSKEKLRETPELDSASSSDAEYTSTSLSRIVSDMQTVPSCSSNGPCGNNTKETPIDIGIENEMEETRLDAVEETSCDHFSGLITADQCSASVSNSATNSLTAFTWTTFCPSAFGQVVAPKLINETPTGNDLSDPKNNLTAMNNIFFPKQYLEDAPETSHNLSSGEKSSIVTTSIQPVLRTPHFNTLQNFSKTLEASNQGKCLFGQTNTNEPLFSFENADINKIPRDKR